MKKILLLFMVLTGISLSTFAQENIWPDPSFEITGQPGGRSGNAGCMDVSVFTHWQGNMTMNVPVVPFATYQLSAYVKGKVEKNAALALYTFNYNCYGWFAAGEQPVKVKDIGNWQKVTRKIISIQDSIYVSPLCFLDAGPGTVWIDDMSMTLVASPENTVAAIKAKPNKTTADRQVLMRWFFSLNDINAAKNSIDFKNTREAAEFFCLMAQRSQNETEKLDFAVKMLAAGCYDFPDAKLRIKELFNDINPSKRLDICKKGIAEYKGKNSKILLCLDNVPDTATPRRLADFRARHREISNIHAEISSMAKSFPKLNWNETLKKWDDLLEQAANDTMDYLGNLGKCKLILGAKSLSPQTHAIVLPPDPTPSETQAANELSIYLERITAVPMDIVSQGQEAGKFAICIGRDRNSTPVDYHKLGNDGIHIQLTPDKLLLAGGKRGVLYAVYTFLEEQLGCRWFTDDCTTVPSSGTFAPKPFTKIHVPKLDYRMTSYIQLRKPELCVPLKLNGHLVKADESWGGNVFYKGWVHTFQSLVPRSKYAAQHPEYYSMINGKRVTEERTQLCLTNPDVLRIATATVREWLQNSSSDVYAVSVSQNDWHHYCQCDKCSALAEKEGSQSGPLLHFVNAIANDIAKDYPNVFIDTLAYQYTRKAPKFIRPAKNVIIRLCSIECCFSHTLEECPFNQSFENDMKDWAKICSRLFVWDYTINFAHSTMPFPNLRVLKPNLNFYTGHGVTGIYEQGNMFTKGGEFQDLRGYVISKLMWDQDYDVDKAITEFTDAYYGPAAPFIREYIELTHDTVCGDTQTHVRIYASPQQYLNRPDYLAKADAILEKAEAAAAHNPTFALRTAVARMPLWYTQLMLKSNTHFPDNKGNLLNKGTDTDIILERFKKAASEVKLTKICEAYSRRPYSAWLEQQKSRSMTCSTITLSNNFGTLLVIPEIGGRIWSYKLANGREIMKVYGNSKDGFRINEGGYEEFSTPDYRAPGWQEPYKILEQTPQKITLSASFINGRTITRTIRLLPDKPGFSVTAQLTGKGDVAMRIHPLFAISSTENTLVWLKNNKGKWISQKLNDSTTSNFYFKDNQCPQGIWGFHDAKTNTAVINRFSNKEIDFCYINAHHSEKRINLEQWSKPQNNTTSITNTYEIISSDFPWK